MLSTTLPNLIILPFLLIVSIPLALSACITTSLAFTTLFLRALVVYFELSFALLANFFLFPARSPASASLLALSSAATTPGVERSSTRTKQGQSHHHHHHHQYYHGSQVNEKQWRESWHAKDVVVEDYFVHHNQSVSLAYEHAHVGKTNLEICICI